ncbi:MAG: alpha/beta hydrolase, partial [Alphaproteobacteria bacterium]|nr:alpha/beta hydrolase [Alphaproteobacteria bacterium]
MMLRALYIIVVCLSVGACSQRAGEAQRLLNDISAGPAPSELKRVTPAPERRAMPHGDLYLPGQGAVAALVLVPGLARTGKDDPRLVAFAESLARARFAVLVPDIASLKALQVRPSQIDEIAAAVAWLSYSYGEVGLVAISYAAGPALLAALRQPVRFVLSIGGYHDITKMVTFLTTGDYLLDGRWRRAEPNAYGKWVFVMSNAGRLSSPAEAAQLAAIAEARLDDRAPPEGPLGPEGRAVMALANNTDRTRVPELIAALPAAIRADMAALDPASADLESQSTRLLLVHGTDDAVVPYSESLDLARRLGPARASLTVVD